VEWLGPQTIPGDICTTCANFGVYSIKLEG
jgi:hypothetical protein